MAADNKRTRQENLREESEAAALGRLYKAQCKAVDWCSSLAFCVTEACIWHSKVAAATHPIDTKKSKQ